MYKTSISLYTTSSHYWLKSTINTGLVVTAEMKYNYDSSPSLLPIYHSHCPIIHTIKSLHGYSKAERQQIQVPGCITTEAQTVCPVPTLCLSHGTGSHLVFVRTGWRFFVPGVPVAPMFPASLLFMMVAASFRRF